MYYNYAMYCNAIMQYIVRYESYIHTSKDEYKYVCNNVNFTYNIKMEQEIRMM